MTVAKVFKTAVIVSLVHLLGQVAPLRSSNTISGRWPSSSQPRSEGIKSPRNCLYMSCSVRSQIAVTASVDALTIYLTESGRSSSVLLTMADPLLAQRDSPGVSASSLAPRFSKLNKEQTIMNSSITTRSSEKKSSLVPAAVATLLITVVKCAVLAQGLVGAGDPPIIYGRSSAPEIRCDYDTALDIVHACTCVSGLMAAFVLFEHKTRIDGMEESRFPLWVSALLVIAIPFAVRVFGVWYIDRFIAVSGGGLQ